MLSAHAYNLVIRPKPVYSLMNQAETCILNDMTIACVKFHWIDAGRVDYRPIIVVIRYSYLSLRVLSL